jgi:hypothetical protein
VQHRSFMSVISESSGPIGTPQGSDQRSTTLQELPVAVAEGPPAFALDVDESENQTPSKDGDDYLRSCCGMSGQVARVGTDVPTMTGSAAETAAPHNPSLLENRGWAGAAGLSQPTTAISSAPTEGIPFSSPSGCRPIAWIGGGDEPTHGRLHHTESTCGEPHLKCCRGLTR